MERLKILSRGIPPVGSPSIGLKRQIIATVKLGAHKSWPRRHYSLHAPPPLSKIRPFFLSLKPKTVGLCFKWLSRSRQPYQKKLPEVADLSNSQPGLGAYLFLMGRHTFGLISSPG